MNAGLWAQLSDPSPFDPRLILRIARLLQSCGRKRRCSRPIEDFDAYLDQLKRFVWRSGFVMKPIFTSARQSGKTA